MKRFGLDIDGTITCPTAFVPYLNKQFNLNITLDDIKTYDFTALVDVTPEEFGKWISSAEGKVYANSPLATGVKPILKQWQQDHELYYISARHERHLQLTKNWFTQHNIPYNHIELIGSHHKIEMVQRYDLDIFFEDKHDNAVAISEECNIPVILFNAPYNQEPIPENVIRVNNWTEASQWVQNWIKNSN